MDEDEVRKGHHCAWQIHYHVVFPVKYRRGLLDEEVVRIIVETAEGIAQRYDIEFESIECDRDHIHILCSAHPRVLPGQVVRVMNYPAVLPRGSSFVRQRITQLARLFCLRRSQQSFEGISAVAPMAQLWVQGGISHGLFENAA